MEFVKIFNHIDLVVGWAAKGLRFYLDVGCRRCGTQVPTAIALSIKSPTCFEVETIAACPTETPEEQMYVKEYLEWCNDLGQSRTLDFLVNCVGCRSTLFCRIRPQSSSALKIVCKLAREPWQEHGPVTTWLASPEVQWILSRWQNQPGCLVLPLDERTEISPLEIQPLKGYRKPMNTWKLRAYFWAQTRFDGVSDGVCYTETLQRWEKWVVDNLEQSEWKTWIIGYQKPLPVDSTQSESPSGSRPA